MDASYLGNPEWPAIDGVEFDRDHEGHWGWTTHDLVGALPAWLDEYTPDVVLLHAGTNDALSGLPTADTLDNLREIVEQLRDGNPTVAVLVARLIPATDPDAGALVDELNGQLGSLVAELDGDDSTVRLVDMNTGFGAELLGDDGFHPNAAGELELAERWLAALDEL